MAIYNKKRKGLIYRYKDEDGRRVSKSMKIKHGDHAKEMAKRLVDSCKDSCMRCATTMTHSRLQSIGELCLDAVLCCVAVCTAEDARF